mmetsp:Transcript_19396/g.47618  ORF Transcript_19396/g.47618 Transcript_19396/m.47618 type:complete len:116 (+) Transcript_19396:37-384(+)
MSGSRSRSRTRNGDDKAEDKQPAVVESKPVEKEDKPDTLATHLTEETRAARVRLDKTDEDSAGRRRSTKPAWMTNPDYCSKVGNTEFMAGKPGFETGKVEKVDPGDPLGDFFNSR